ncbi:hypothetical protein GY45DRAFT_1240795 [Cubamyces sp. BRFM 1775]|nr:hypothetical protein GY45DRAFT_1240795 [Cubamyces sp. BRFM 1775]
MTDSSDTESESSQSVEGWEAADFIQMSTELGRISDPTLVGPRQVLEALDTLQGLDICAVGNDERLHGTIQRISSTLLSFLDRVLTTVDLCSETALEDFALAFPILLSESTLSLLLKYRVLFRDIALHDLEASASAITTAAWLFHLDAPVVDVPLAHSVEWYDEGLVGALETAPSAALSMLLRVLQQSVDAARDRPETLDAISLDVTIKACWGIKHILQLSDVEHAALAGIYGIVIELFVVLGECDIELHIKDLVLEIVSPSPTDLQLAVNLVGGPQSRYALAWEQSESVATAIAQEDDIVDTLDLRDIRQMLQFLTLTARMGSTPATLSDLPQRVLFAIFDLLGSESMESLTWTMLGDATILALARSLHHASFKRTMTVTEQVRIVWGLVREADPSDLPLAASLATYISATAGACVLDALSYGEAWSFLRDVLLLVLDRDFGGQEEPLALLVASAICRALVELARHESPQARRYYVSSPWTLSMVARLQQLKVEEVPDAEDYYRILADLIAPYRDSMLSVVCRA